MRGLLTLVKVNTADYVQYKQIKRKDAKIYFGCNKYPMLGICWDKWQKGE